MKRFLDIVIASIALAVVALPMLAIALAVRLVLGKPIFFVQERVGRHGVPFKLIKFRTMREAYAADGEPLRDADRTTRFGSFLRKTSLDELPQLVNVLKGGMSVVGPRPLPVNEYRPLSSPERARRHEVLPGITGWAQVKGRNTLSWAEQFRLDLWYVDNQSLWLDFRILCLTTIVVFQTKGSTDEGTRLSGCGPASAD
jgi:lipopolysaccharide/colanic/teichoic acid biosynthesis glycosyltransferase